MRGYVAIVAIMAVSVMGVMASYDHDKLRSKVNAAIEADWKKFNVMADKYWALAAKEQDSAQAVRYNLAAAAIGSIATIRLQPLASATGRMIKGLRFEEEIDKLQDFSAQLNIKTEEKLSHLLNLATGLNDAKTLFNDISTLARMTKQSDELLAKILSEGQKDYTRRQDEELIYPY